MTRHLYLQIYLALVAALALFAMAAATVWWVVPRDRHADLFLDGLAALVGEAMPEAARPPAEQQAALARLGAKFGADVTLLDPHDVPIASTGRQLSAPRPPAGGSGLVRAPDVGMVVALALPDGRRLLAHRQPPRHHGPLGALVMLALLAGTLALGSWPVARRLTRRLERLRTGVDDLGRGDLDARVGVEGRDEVADLARSFNRTAERIERLVRAQQQALATASHELRSPLARMRVAIELLGDDTRPDIRQGIARDIAELDELIDEILLTSRLEASPNVERRENVDLLALVAEEGSRVKADVAGTAITVRGNARLLRRLVRNLFENARRYGGGSKIEAEVADAGNGCAILRVSDRGPGIPAGERERVFEAFYRRTGTSETDGGSVGLGLALVRRIAESHAGSASALERQGGGTTVEVVIRRA